MNDNINVSKFQRLFDNMSECYKLFWFKAVLDAVFNGETELVYEDIINDMICEAWYMVQEYKLNLGPKDYLEIIVKRLGEITGFPSNVKPEIVLEFLHTNKDIEITRIKRILIENVPYRLQAPFLPNRGEFNWGRQVKKVAGDINGYDGIIYYYLNIDGLKSVIKVNDIWAEYFIRNYEVLTGWVEFNVITYLQKRNPDVPGISNKIHAPQERDLVQVKKYWDIIISQRPIIDIYSGIPVEQKGISVDHFIPWSYVTHDELWNLTPTTRSINSSKSNSLPDYQLYFDKLAKQEYENHVITSTNEQIEKEFEKCRKKHISDLSILGKMYRHDIQENEFRYLLNELIEPIYLAAEKQGFGQWNYNENN